MKFTLILLFTNSLPTSFLQTRQVGKTKSIHFITGNCFVLFFYCLLRLFCFYQHIQGIFGTPCSNQHVPKHFFTVLLHHTQIILHYSSFKEKKSGKEIDLWYSIYHLSSNKSTVKKKFIFHRNWNSTWSRKGLKTFLQKPLII